MSKNSSRMEAHVKLDGKTFARYTNFDSFVRQRGWYKPIFASMILITLSFAILLGMPSRHDTLAGLLMGIGIGIPLIFFGLYFIQLRVEISRQRLNEAPNVYSLFFSDNGIKVINDRKKEDPIQLKWNDLWAAFRRRDAAYIYVNPQRAFIVPYRDLNVSEDSFWQYIKENLGATRAIEGRGR